MKIVNLENYKKDTYYPKVVSAVDTVLKKGNLVTPIDVFVTIGMLEPGKLKEWQSGRVLYLEKVINGNLSKFSRVIRIFRFHAHDLNLRPQSCIERHGKKVLRYSKSGAKKLEEAYSCGYLKVEKKKKLDSTQNTTN